MAESPTGTAPEAFNEGQQEEERETEVVTPAADEPQEGKGGEKQIMTQLFGSDSSENEEEEEEKKKPEAQETELNDFDVHFEDGQQGPQAKSDVMEIPTIPLPQGKLHTCKAPQSLAFQQKRFDQNTFEEERESAQMKKLNKTTSDNLIRWRHVLDSEGNNVLDQDGRPKVQSNSRIVQWSDGSFHLQVGEMYFEMKTRKTGPNEHRFLYAQQMAKIDNAEELCLQCHGQLASGIHFFERSEKETLAVRYHEKKVKRQMKKIRKAQDPEHERKLRMERWQTQQNASRQQMEDSPYRRRARQGQSYHQDAQAMSDEEVADDAFDAGERGGEESIASLRAEFGKGKGKKRGSSRKPKQRQRKEQAPMRSQRHSPARAAVQADPEPESDEEEEATFELDDDDDEPIAQVAKRSRRAVVDDEDSD